MDVTLAGSAAADSTITKVEGADDVNVSVEKTDKDGNVTTEVVTPTPDVTPAPEVTTTPSGGGSTGGNGGSGSGSGSGTTTPTPVPGVLGKVTYKVGTEDVEVDVTPSADKTSYTGKVEVANGTKTVTFTVAQTDDYKVATGTAEITDGKGTAEIKVEAKDKTKNVDLTVTITVTEESATTEKKPGKIGKLSCTTNTVSGAAVDVTETDGTYTGILNLTAATAPTQVTVQIAATDDYQAATETVNIANNTGSVDLILKPVDAKKDTIEEITVKVTVNVEVNSTGGNTGNPESIAVKIGGNVGVTTGGAITTSGAAVTINGTSVKVSEADDAITGTHIVSLSSGKTSANVTFTGSVSGANGVTVKVEWFKKDSTTPITTDSITANTEYTFKITKQ